MSAKFTEGPWSLSPCSHGGAIVVRGKYGQHPQSHVQIVPIEDAHLIAAAPDLYEALKMLPLDAFDKPMEQMDAADFVDHAADFVNAMESARAALRKADGETNGTD